MKSIRKYLVVGVLASLLGTLTSTAVPVTHGSEVYDVVAFTPNASYNDVFDIISAQPWWGDQAFATSAAEQVNSQLGAFYAVESGWGPFFVFGGQQGTFWHGDENSIFGVGFSPSFAGFTYAVVNTQSSVPDDGITGILLGSVLLGIAAFSRRSVRV